MKNSFRFIFCLTAALTTGAALAGRAVNHAPRYHHVGEREHSVIASGQATQDVETGTIGGDREHRTVAIGAADLRRPVP